MSQVDSRSAGSGRVKKNKNKNNLRNPCTTISKYSRSRLEKHDVFRSNGEGVMGRRRSGERGVEKIKF